MARRRRDTQETVQNALERPLRIVASGTLFVTHTLGLPTHPEPSTVNRAHSVQTSRGGSASNVSSLLAQFPTVDAMLVVPLGGNDEGRVIMRDLEKEGVNLRFCKVWDASGVPSAWVLQADDSETRTVINHNPLPDITHEEFVSLLGPILVPENYMMYNSEATSPTLPAQNQAAASSRQQPQSPPVLPTTKSPVTNPNSPAPFEWIHFEGRSVKTTLNNIVGLEGFARERKWRSHCVFSVDVGLRARQGVEALIPHADVIFLNKHYAQAQSPRYSTPRAFLLSLSSSVPQHALLVAHWGAEGSALLSLPTREYLQSSGWVDSTEDERVGKSRDATMNSAFTQQYRAMAAAGDESDNDGVMSVRTGSDFFAGTHTSSASFFTAGASWLTPEHAARRNRSGSTSSQDTEVASNERRQPQGNGNDANAEVIDEVGAQDAFVAGMIYALSRRILPGAPYTPSAITRDGPVVDTKDEKGRWRLDECLRFATELAGRKARRKGWAGLADEMRRAGWFDG
ncbi:hypothetical protein NEOLEDRAFT_1144570 [Neolentinus lepideus HHB14362 ss-1]|uniref:Carbohydrate kinase PfkB domain-containing protein n=1 Tax=Neolentinus lepideus HHB14362 ss-1 TaxID=1314782 RepID=A0A165VS21_9AGAM|nr:hypothetical protein NEOLEDRAFT_1144570 [Neolentinus lepideus HHB14362 ss-1]